MNRWIVNGKTVAKDTLALYCFPYAGSGSHVYRGWQEQIEAGVAVFPVELPGRGTRMPEPPFRDLDMLVAAAIEGLGSHLRPPFAFFGHSMGALISFELARALRRRGLPEPEKIYVSGNRAPHLQSSGPVLHVLPDDDFLRELGRLNGTPRTVLEHKELMDLLLPVLRADFAVCENYRYHETPPLDIPIVAFGGIGDQHVTHEDLLAWAMYTTKGCVTHMLPGDHFFLHSSQSRLLAILRADARSLTLVSSTIGEP